MLTDPILINKMEASGKKKRKSKIESKTVLPDNLIPQFNYTLSWLYNICVYIIFFATEN